MRTIDEIERLRKEARVTRTELCRRAGVHLSTYGRITRLEVSPTVRTLSAIDRALNAIVDDIRATVAA